MGTFDAKTVMVALGVGLVGGVVGYFIGKKKDETPGTRGIGYHAAYYGPSISRRAMPVRVGGLYLPTNGSLPVETRMGLLTASKRYGNKGVNLVPSYPIY